MNDFYFFITNSEEGFTLCKINTAILRGEPVPHILMGSIDTGSDVQKQLYPTCALFEI